MNVEPLRALRLRTPRLELRLATGEELEELFHVAEAGIHPPEEMPFEFAWTDDLRLDPYLEHHRSKLEHWRSDDWGLELIAFLAGRPVGAQGMRAERFAETRRVVTGSWLGSAYQRQGLGTEMRTAVLELAFRGLGAREAVSGALQGNAASARVSEKLGYSQVGTSEVSPRGVPIPHTDLVLARDRWRPPFAVEIESLEPALPLFGVTLP
jgi:RimJ/RimL family protein N-acetyltransferase